MFAPHRQVRVPHGWCCRPACVDLLRGSVVSRMLRAFSFLASLCGASRAVLGIIEFIASGAFYLRTPSPSGHCPPLKAALSCSHTSAWRAAVLTSHSRRTAPPPLNSSVRRQSIFFVFAAHRQVRVPHGWCCGPACVDLLRGSVASRTLRAF